MLDRRPIVSGILFGLLTVKPQLGLLLPLLLVLTGRWRCIAAAAITTIMLMGVTACIFGADIWPRYVAELGTETVVLAYPWAGIFPSMMPTAFMNARIAGWTLPWAWTAQGFMSAAAIVAAGWTFWRRRDPVLSTALFLVASFLVTPYAFNYDMVVMGWVLAQLRDHEEQSP